MRTSNVGCGYAALCFQRFPWTLPSGDDMTRFGSQSERITCANQSHLRIKKYLGRRQEG